MSRRELRALGIELNQENTMVTEPTEPEETMPIQVNPFQDVIDLSSSEGNNLCQKGTQGLSNDQK